MLIKVLFDNKEFIVTSVHKETILDTLLRNKFDAPHSCKLGFCSVCPVKLINGEVEIDDDSILTQKEKELGIIVTCQSYPKSDITIKYD